MDTSIATLDLTEGQQAIVRQQTGIVLRRLRFDAPQLRALALAAEAATRGHPPRGVDHPIRLELTREQCSTCLEAGADVRAILIDPDAPTVRFHEDWTADGPVTLTQTLRVSWLPGPAEPGLVRLAPPTDRGDVFGTGAHSTTALTARLLEASIAQGDRVLDLGTGSGVLAVAAVRLGAGSVDAVDIDPAAVASAQQALVLNQVQDRARVWCASVEAVGGVFDLVLANLLPAVLITHSGAISQRVRPGGRLVISGVVAPRLPSVLRRYQAAGFSLVDQLVIGDWGGLGLLHDS